MKKQQNKPTEIFNYEKVYEHPLDWCPQFGYLPKLDNTHLKNKPEAYLIADKCLGIIKTARLYLGVADHQMAINLCLPVVKKLIFPYKERENESKVIRLLFQNLDFLALKTSPDPLAVDMCNGIVITKRGIPHKPIGRASNVWDNCFSSMASEIKVNHHVVRERLLFEAQKITGEVVNLDYIMLFSLYAILEAWLILTALLFKPGYNTSDLLNFSKRLSYADDLLNTAIHYSEIEEKNELYDEIQNNKNKAINASKTGGSKPKALGFQEAIKQAIKIKKTTNASILWKYFKVNYKGKKNSIKFDIYLIYYLPDKSLNNSDGFLYQFNIKNKKIRKNTFSAFEKNIHKVKNDLNKE